MSNINRSSILWIYFLLFATATSNAQSLKGADLPFEERNAQQLGRFNLRWESLQIAHFKAAGSKTKFYKSIQGFTSSPLLDNSFGANGGVRTTFGSGVTNAFGRSVAAQKDGKIVAVGFASDNSGSPFGNSAFALVRYDANGELDSTFGTNGTVRTQFNGGVAQDYGYSMAIEDDGKIVVAGKSDNNGQGSTFAVARYDTDGALDSTFGLDGRVTIQINGSTDNDAGYSVALQANGEIVVAGASNNSFAVARLNSNGVLDNAFGTNGKVTAEIQGGDGTADYGSSVALQSDGKIVVAGTSYSFLGGGNAFAIARFDSNGALDSTFGGSGSVRAPLGRYGPNAECRAVAIQSDGKLVVAGFFNNDDGTGNKFAAYRYNINGTLDSSFGSNGLVRTSIPGGNSGDDEGFSVVLQSDGKLVIAGSSSSGSEYAFAVARYDTGGMLDSTFGTGGTARMAISGGNGIDDRAAAVVVESDGKIVLAGSSTDTSCSSFAIARLDSGGSLDIGFGEGGTVRTPINGGFASDVASAVAVQSDGKIVVAGHSLLNAGMSSEFAIARYGIDGSLDNTFGSNGLVRNAISGGDGGDVGVSVALQSDGKILVAGQSRLSLGDAFAVARYNTNGALDNTFGTNGTVRTVINGGDGTVDQGKSIAVQSDGKIVVGGLSHNTSGYVFAVARYNSDGTPDHSFGTAGTVTTSINGGAGNDYGWSIAVQKNGKIVVAGQSFSSSGNAFAVARFNSNGTLDNSFGTNGTARTHIGGGDGTDDDAESVGIDPNGKLVVGGMSHRDDGYLFAVARYNVNGTLDTSFGTNGTVITQISGGSDYGLCSAVQSDGKIVLAGFSSDSAGDAFAMARYKMDGTLDSTLNAVGTIRTQLSGDLVTQDIGTSVAIQRNGKIVMAGFSIFVTGSAFAVVRYLPGSEPFASSLPATNIDTSDGEINGVVFPFRINSSARFIFGKKSLVYTDSVTASPGTASGDTTTFISAVLSSLTPRTTYYYRVAGTTSSPQVYFRSEEKSFTTLDPTPQVPYAVSPNGITGVPRRTTFAWRLSTYAKEYYFQVTGDSSFSSVVFDTLTADTTFKLGVPLAATSRYYWHVSAIDTSGSSFFSLTMVFTTGTGIDAVDESNGIPLMYALYQNYPNPFNPSTTIRFDLKEQSNVKIEIYDALGQRVIEENYGTMNAGRFNKTINMDRFASGVYLYWISAVGKDGQRFVSIKKLMLVK
ncbi:MAG TPA: T9SS type A sorting domain-containing protein [Candidatus Kryptonia bacterium]